MDSLTSFLLSEHGELSLDAYTDNMLANLPHQPSQYDPLASIVPFGTDLTKGAGFTGATIIKQQPVQQELADPLTPLPWDVSLPGAPVGVPSGMPNVATQAMPMYADSQQAPFVSAAGPASQPVSPVAAAQQDGQQANSSSGSGRKGEPDIAKLHERIQKQKEKNARNQRQFRKRAKEKAVMIEEQVQQLTAKLQDMELEKRSLIARNKVLEAALASAKGAADKVSATSPLALVLAMASSAEWPGQMGPIVLRKRDGGPLTLTVEVLQRMTLPELTSLYKEYTNAIAMALVTSNNSLSGSSGQRLQELVDETHALMRGIAVHNATLIHQHQSRRMDVHSLQEQRPPPGFYDNIIELMQLTKEQKEQILAHRHIKLVSLARLVLERRELQARLKACNEATANPVESVPCLGLGAEFPHLLEVTERLNDNVAQLHRSVCLFIGTAWREVLTALQAGIFMVQAFPWAADMLSLANALAEQAKAPSVKEIFADVLSSPPTSFPQLTSSHILMGRM